MKNNLLKLNHLVSSNSYTIYQEDYYGITVEINETGTTNLYQDNFIVTEFEQKIGDDSVVEGRTEIGIDDVGIYQFTYYGEDDIDHIDNNGLNNCKYNLRIISHSLNLTNQHNSNNGVKKVPSGRYQAHITLNGKSIYLGTFDTFEEAYACIEPKQEHSPYILQETVVYEKN